MTTTPTPDAAPKGLTLDVMAIEAMAKGCALTCESGGDRLPRVVVTFDNLPDAQHANSALAHALAARLAGAAPAGEGVPSLVLAISGGLGSGKASLAAALAERIGGDHISFGAEVRKIATEMGEDPSDIDVLQRIGQALVVTDSAGLVDRVLASRDASQGGGPLVIAGLRHVEVLWELRQRFADVRVVHVDTPDDVRADRLVERESTERRLAARYDNALSEVQTRRILPQYASVVVHGTLPVELQVARIVTCLGLDNARLAATPSPARSLGENDAVLGSRNVAPLGDRDALDVRVHLSDHRIADPVHERPPQVGGVDYLGADGNGGVAAVRVDLPRGLSASPARSDRPEAAAPTPASSRLVDVYQAAKEYVDNHEHGSLLKRIDCYDALRIAVVNAAFCGQQNDAPTAPLQLANAAQAYVAAIDAYRRGEDGVTENRMTTLVKAEAGFRAALAAAPTPPEGEGVDLRACPESTVEDHLRYLTAFAESAKLPGEVKADAEDAIASIRRLTTPATGTDEALRVAAAERTEEQSEAEIDLLEPIVWDALRECVVDDEERGPITLSVGEVRDIAGHLIDYWPFPALGASGREGDRG